MFSWNEVKANGIKHQSRLMETVESILTHRSNMLQEADEVQPPHPLCLTVLPSLTSITRSSSFISDIIQQLSAPPSRSLSPQQTEKVICLMCRERV